MHVYRSMLIDAPIDRVWTAIRAFNGVAEWNPAVTAAHLEQGRGTEVGAIRHLDIVDATVFRETLLAHSDVEYFYTYDILESPLPLTHYISTHRLIPVTASNQTLGIWESRFQCDPSVANEMERIVGDDIYLGGMAGLNAFLKES